MPAKVKSISEEKIWITYHKNGKPIYAITTINSTSRDIYFLWEYKECNDYKKCEENKNVEGGIIAIKTKYKAANPLELEKYIYY